MKKKIWLSILAVLLVAGILPSVAWAHANLVRSDPADGASLEQAPSEIRLWFDEPISPQFSSAQLFDVNSKAIEIAGLDADPQDPTLLIVKLPDLPDGLYSILYKTLSDSDGHSSQGLFVFGVGVAADSVTASFQPDISAPPIVEVLLRWLNFSALAGLVGALAVARFVLPSGEPAPEVFFAARQRIYRFSRWCGLAGLLIGLGLLIWQINSLFTSIPEGTPVLSTAWALLSKTRWGLAWLFREGLFFLLIVSLGMRIGRSKRLGPSPLNTRLDQARQKGHALAEVSLSFGLLASQAFSGHASGLASNAPLALIVDGVHLLAASLWVGGLLALVMGLLPLVRKKRKDMAALVKAGWKPFSWMAAFSVGTLFATGFYSTGRQVASLDALLTTFYGQALIVKVSLVLAVGAIGLLNSMLLHPVLAAPLARLLRRPSGWTLLSLKQFPVLVSAEVCLGLVVIFMTGMVTASAAPRNAEYNIVPEDVPGALSQNVDDLVVTLSVKPNRPGQNVFTVFAASERRPPPAEIARVLLRFEHEEQETGKESVTAEAIGRDRYVIGGNHLSLAGPWGIDVVVRRLGMEDSVAHFDWVVAPPGEAQPVVVSKAPIGSITALAASLMLIILSISAYIAFVRKTQSENPRQGGKKTQGRSGANNRRGKFVKQLFMQKRGPR